MTDRPPRALLSRDAALPHELWYALGRNIAADAALHVDDRHLSVPMERLLSTRGWLASQLDSYGCAFEASPQVTELLRRHEAEREEIDTILRNGVDPPALDGA